MIYKESLGIVNIYLDVRNQLLISCSVCLRYCKKNRNSVGIARQLFIDKNFKINLKFCTFSLAGPSQGPRFIRRRPAAARFVGLQVRIPMGHRCLSLVSVVRQRSVLGPITPPEDCYRGWCV